MREKPFFLRIEKQYNWQVTRATADGKPAILNGAAMAGFKHTPRLTYGAGIAALMGLGHSWEQVRFTFEGFGFRTFATWDWQYGIGAYAGYERTYKQAVFSDTKEIISPAEYNVHNRRTYNEALLAGITKKYNIGGNWSGSIQLLYDAWWQDKGLRSPVQLRFATMKK